MKWIVFGAAFLLLGCSASKRVMRHWNRIQREIALNPGLADSLKIVDRDTIRTERIVDKLVYQPVIDSALIDSLATILCETLKSSEQEAKKIAEPIRRKLATSGCPDVSKDTTYMVKITYKGATAEIPVRLSVHLKDGELKVDILADEIEIPTQHPNLKIEVKESENILWKNPWFWSVVGIILILILLIVWTLLRR